MKERTRPVIDAGIFLVDKPVGPTSFRMVQYVRRAMRMKKVGHAGTLDPFASGLLIICAGRPATKIIPLLMSGTKEYEATLKLGVETDTHDLEGMVVATRPVDRIDKQEVVRCLAGFVGEQLQTPPSYSALKHKGKPLYYYARKGIKVDKEPRPVLIKDIRCLGFTNETLKINVRCGKGTYIRSLAADIGSALGCGAHLVALRRLRSGLLSVEDAAPGELLADPERGREILLGRLLTVDDVMQETAHGYRCNETFSGDDDHLRL